MVGNPMIEQIRRWLELVAICLFVLAVACSASSVFGRPRNVNYRMSDFDEEDKPGKLPK
jgi:hypothetical protein